MQNSRDSSVFRGLARPLGDALAFGMGMTLAQNARKRPERSPGEPAAGGPIEAAIDNAVSSRIEASFDILRREIDTMQHDFAKTLGSLLAEQVGKEVNERRGADLGRLRSEIAQTQREFADAVAKIVAQQIESRMEALAGDIERRIGEQAAAVRAEMVQVHEGFAESMTAFLSEQIESQVLMRTGAIQRALSEQIESAVSSTVHEQTAGVRQETAAAHEAMSGFLSAVETACRTAAGKTSAGVPAPHPTPSAEEPRTPEFSPLKKTGELLRIPLVSSLMLVAGGLLLVHFA